MNELEQFRASVLATYGADESVTKELLAYNQNQFQHDCLSTTLELPLPPEIHLADWSEYAAKAEEIGAFSVLKDVFVQWQFPIEAGISQTEAYRAATLKNGSRDPEGYAKRNRLDSGAGLVLQQPKTLHLFIHQSLAGNIPVISVKHRGDFVAIVRSLTKRNEPEAIPESMGACIVSGYNNWARIHSYKQQWQQQNPDRDSQAWDEEFKRLISRKELYQDRFLILSHEFYSNVAPEQLDLTANEWRDLSFKIRLEHECTHYFTYRLFKSMRNNLLDELIADYAGIVAATGSYRADWFLHFMGLEAYPDYREGGRLQNYRGQPPLSDEAFKILQRLIRVAALNLEDFSRMYAQPKTADRLALIVFSLTYLTIEELASSQASDRIDQVLSSWQQELLTAR